MPVPEPHDGELLRSWLEAGSEDSFRRLVARYAGLVLQCARRSSGEPMIADEAAQLTFILLARKARTLQSRTSLAGWLHTTALLQTRNLMRTQHRENRKRHAINAMTPTTEEVHSKAWHEMAPVLDAALAALREDDREAILLRFHRGLPYADVAAALGIAGEAARKRVDRAVERLRKQLQRRGCPLETSACVGALGLFATDAQAAAAAPFLASQALKAAAAGSTALTTTTIAIIMTKKTTIAATAALLLAGAGAVVLIKKDDPSKSASGGDADGRPPRALTSEASGLTSNNSRARQRDPVRYPDLAERYGESRTNLAKHVSTNVIGLLEDAVGMMEMASSGQLGGFGGGGMGLRAALGRNYNTLNLTEDQQTAAAALYADFQKREMERAKDSIGKLKEDPTALMRLMLASDAFKRGELSEEEYKALQAESGSDLAGVMNPLDRNNFRGGQPMGDEAFVSGFQALLSPEQAGTFQSSLDQRAERAAAAAQNSAAADPANIANIPAMELEQLDRAVNSGRAITGGLKQMMEGVGGLQDLAPLIEQPRGQE
jgi:RNA polymerase sigma factor (sigma-70 family)